MLKTRPNFNIKYVPKLQILRNWQRGWIKYGVEVHSQISNAYHMLAISLVFSIGLKPNFDCNIFGRK